MPIEQEVTGKGMHIVHLDEVFDREQFERVRNALYQELDLQGAQIGQKYLDSADIKILENPNNKNYDFDNRFYHLPQCTVLVSSQYWKREKSKSDSRKSMDAGQIIINIVADSDPTELISRINAISGFDWREEREEAIES